MLPFARSDNDSRQVILRIRQSTIASPVNVSAWGTAEGEVFTNPTSEYRIISAEVENTARTSGDERLVIHLEEIVKREPST